jgi:hypothetical protein
MPMAHDAPQNNVDRATVEDNIGQPLTKDLLRRKNRIDRFAEEILRPQVEPSDRQATFYKSDAKKRLSLDISNFGFEYANDAQSSTASSPIQKYSDVISSDRSSLFQTDQSDIVKNNIAMGSIATTPSRVNSEISEDDDLMDDSEAINHIWLQLPRWSVTSGLKSMFYRIASRCVRSRRCENVQFLLDLSSDSIKQAALNIGAVHKSRNEYIRNHALHRLDDRRSSVHTKSRNDRYTPSILSMDTNISSYHHSVVEDSNLNPGFISPHYQWSNPGSKSFHITPRSSVTSLSSSSLKAAEKRVSRSTAPNSRERRSIDIMQHESLQSIGEPSSQDINGKPPPTPKLMKLGVFDPPEEEPIVHKDNIRFEHTSLFFISKTNKFRLFLWTIIGKW